MPQTYGLAACSLPIPEPQHFTIQEIVVQLYYSIKQLNTISTKKNLGILKTLKCKNKLFLTYISNTSKPKNKVLIFTKHLKEKKLIISLFKSISCPLLEYENTIWSPIISNISINKLPNIYSTNLSLVIGCRQDTDAQNLHNKTSILLMSTHECGVRVLYFWVESKMS